MRNTLLKEQVLLLFTCLPKDKIRRKNGGPTTKNRKKK
jgi:hypothetical protein